MSDFTVVKEGTWLYDGTVPTGVRIVSCSIRYGSGDWKDPQEIQEDQKVPGFDVQWASPTTPRDFWEYQSAVFPTLQDAIAHAEQAAWASSTLKWNQL
ncbi:hypothetical protein [Acidovorax sp. ST3]|uniref:hypothetical protein n=1 Tax=Acidovorax sp. ST3 TaxID=2219062 RepID=UPI00129060F7|nr:hypothetical protein [Acidovorax sp. ST3]